MGEPSYSRRRTSARVRMRAAVQVHGQGDGGVGGRVRVVAAPDQGDRDRGSVAQRAVGDAVPAVLGGGRLRGDPDTAAGGDGGQPVVHVGGGLPHRRGGGGPQGPGGGAG